MARNLPPGCTQRECDEAQPGYWDDPPQRWLECDACEGSGGISKWDKLPLRPETANGHGVSLDFYERCPKCDGRGRIEEPQ